jgi:enamine deaminase RidA (YjgF/YER057c/UK114 family)
VSPNVAVLQLRGRDAPPQVGPAREAPVPVVEAALAAENAYAYSRAVRVGDRVFISGSTALTARGVEGPGDMYRQTRATMDTIGRALAEAGGVPGDLVYTKTFLTDLDKAADYTRAFVEALGEVRPVSTLLGVPALVRPELLVEIEAEAVLGAARSRRDIYTQHLREKPRGYARAVAVGDQVYLSGCTSVSSAGEMQAPHDWARQYDLAMETIRWALGQAGASIEDVVRRRAFTVQGAQQNRPYGEGPAPFAASHPASLGCRISGLARPELVVEIEVTAVKGAGAGIEWIGPDLVDPLDAA